MDYLCIYQGGGESGDKQTKSGSGSGQKSSGQGSSQGSTASQVSSSGMQH